MALVAHYDLELHQMDVKIAFLNGNINETIYMMQPENFVSRDPKKMNCKPGDTPVVKGDKFSLKQCPKGSLEVQEMQKIPYASAVGSLMYAQVCTRPDIAYIVGVLGRYLSNPGIDYWKAAKKVMRYLKKTRDYMLTYRRSDHFEIIGYSDSDFAGCQDSRRSTSGYIYLLGGGAMSWRSAKQTLIASSTMAA
ncbi:secreted RxLR effector protein 161-like [Humulus lupulus]|uniref:secreted RxLR effector protein 161-like n=1 Tax=Humulus lupulus TaxID=3486 RepID=UPI002B411605|nr:secreted RxLR effector protein 161-like [Humulus lupulus]